ncbi:unnamed protein product, partial [Mesorhabditis spiculigera]
MEMIQLAKMVAAEQEKQAIERLLQTIQVSAVGFQAVQPTLFINPFLPTNEQNLGNTNGAPAVQQKKIITIFVGNISEKCTDEFMSQMLEECGKVNSWKRIKGSNGKLQPFGFCEYETPEGGMRALRILHEFQIGEKKLNIKADDKVRAIMVEHWNRRRTSTDKPLFKPTPGKELPVDEEMLRVDEEVRLKILNAIEKDHPELLIIEDGEVSDRESSRKRGKDDGRRRDDRKEASPSLQLQRLRLAQPLILALVKNFANAVIFPIFRSSASTYGKKKENRSRSRSAGSEDSEEAREKKALRKQLKEKEQAYIARLKKWEQRERRMARAYEKEETKEQQRRRDVQKEAKKLRHFLEDYDDEKEDGKYYKGGSLFQRTRDYEREKEQDALDRKREQQEIEELKKQLIAEGKDGELAEEEAKKRHRQQEEEALRKLREDSGSPNPHKPAGAKDGESSDSESGSSSDSDNDDGPDSKKKKADGGWMSSPAVEKTGDEASNMGANTPTPAAPTAPTTAAPTKWKSAISLGGSANTSAATAATSSPSASSTTPRPGLTARLNGVFGMEDEEEAPVRTKLKPFQITNEDRMQLMSAEERKKRTKELLESIPSKKDELFAAKIHWEFVDKAFEARIRAWVDKKIKEYIGEPDKTLVDFVYGKIESKVQPDVLLKDMKLILDHEAETFILKLWRVIVYETELRRLGYMPVGEKK